MTVSYEQAREIVRAKYEPNWPDDFGTFCIDDRQITENDELYVFRIGVREYLVENNISYAIVPGTVPVVYKTDGRLDTLSSSVCDARPSAVTRPNPSPALKI
ncbi:hypothetical protein [Nocardia sp. CS682]|uniref:hypothetical protein n=1 Tax=Nocardia sp. CS682 TaxID=1047172 RepID=UPI0010754DEC|nr:hypothetical protein [Nocardia sp. CS682]QBS45312.1 hypothetical protein DMB37_39775 [Nocardia sp. CS682]